MCGYFTDLYDCYVAWMTVSPYSCLAWTFLAVAATLWLITYPRKG